MKKLYTSPEIEMLELEFETIMDDYGGLETEDLISGSDDDSAEDDGDAEPGKVIVRPAYGDIDQTVKYQETAACGAGEEDHDDGPPEPRWVVVDPVDDHSCPTR